MNGDDTFLEASDPKNDLVPLEFVGTGTVQTSESQMMSQSFFIQLSKNLLTALRTRQFMNPWHWRHLAEHLPRVPYFSFDHESSLR